MNSFNTGTNGVSMSRLFPKEKPILRPMNKFGISLDDIPEEEFCSSEKARKRAIDDSYGLMNFAPKMPF